MALVIEDGTIIANANSYVTDAEYVAYAAARGLTIGATATLREIELIKSMDYLQCQEYQGRRTEPDNQLLPFPRIGVVLYGLITDSDNMPKEIKNSQMEGGIAAYSQDLAINEVSENVASEKLDTLSISYHNKGKQGRIRLDRVFTWLKPLLMDMNQLVRT